MVHIPYLTTDVRCPGFPEKLRYEKYRIHDAEVTEEDFGMVRVKGTLQWVEVDVLWAFLSETPKDWPMVTRERCKWSLFRLFGSTTYTEPASHKITQRTKEIDIVISPTRLEW